MLELCRYDPAAFQASILYRTNLNLRVAHFLDSGRFCSRYLRNPRLVRHADQVRAENCKDESVSQVHNDASPTCEITSGAMINFALFAE
jgi:hypothetical protein